MNTILIAGYPKTGNTLMGETLKVAGKLIDDSYDGEYDIYKLKRAKVNPLPNPAFQRFKACNIKTHSIFKSHATLSNYFAPVTHIVRITRNPLDTLLSAINFLRVDARLSKSYRRDIPTIKQLFPYYPLRPWTSVKAFMNDFTLDKLHSQGYLENALRNFSRSGLVIDKFYAMSGSWRSNHESWSHSGLPMLDLSYEELVDFQQSNITHTLATFLEVEHELLAKAFGIQSEHVKSIAAKGNDVYNKAKKEYFVSYFSPKSLRHFVDYNYSSMHAMGYESLCDMIYDL